MVERKIFLQTYHMVQKKKTKKQLVWLEVSKSAQNEETWSQMCSSMTPDDDAIQTWCI